MNYFDFHIVHRQELIDCEWSTGTHLCRNEQIGVPLPRSNDAGTWKMLSSSVNQCQIFSIIYDKVDEKVARRSRGPPCLGIQGFGGPLAQRWQRRWHSRARPKNRTLQHVEQCPEAQAQVPSTTPRLQTQTVQYFTRKTTCNGMFFKHSYSPKSYKANKDVMIIDTLDNVFLLEDSRYFKHLPQRVAVDTDKWNIRTKRSMMRTGSLRIGSPMSFQLSRWKGKSKRWSTFLFASQCRWFLVRENQEISVAQRNLPNLQEISLDLPIFHHAVSAWTNSINVLTSSL